MIIANRPRRNRSSVLMRELVQESQLQTEDLVYPLFVIEGKSQRVPIASMPGQFRFSLDELVKEVEESIKYGVKVFCLFPVLAEKDKNKQASFGHDENHFYQTAIKTLKDKFSDIIIMTDIAMDPYSSDGHDGYVNDKGEIDNDITLEILGKMALTQAKSGADLLGPSDMMDGRVAYIRELLENQGHNETGIISYTAKYSSAFYGPFREALDSAPRGGDKKTYQMDPANAREALREAFLDEEEGADILMVKPGLAYLDIVSLLRQNTTLPIAAYNVSGEYAMVKAAAEKGWIDEQAVMMESLLAFKRAGADIILTYFAKSAAQLINS